MKKLDMFKAVECPISGMIVAVNFCECCAYKVSIERTNWQMWCKYPEGGD